MYVNFFDHFQREEHEAKTIGIVLCSDKNDAMVRITLPDENEQALAARYQIYLPTEDELRAELERERDEAERLREVASPTTPSRPTGVRTAETVADVKTMLKDDSFRESMITAAFGNIRSRSCSYEVSSVKKSGEGFELTITKSHWMTRALQDEVAVFMNKAGVPSTLPGTGGTPQPAINIHPDTFRPQPAIQPLPNTFVDTKKFGRDLQPEARDLLMAHGERLSRSDAVLVGDVVKNTKGTMDVTFQIAHFLTKDVRKEVTLEIGLDQRLIGGASPAAGNDPLPKLKKKLEENARALTMGELGQTLSRSDAVEVASIKKNSGGTYGVVFNVVHWQTRKPRMELPFEVDKNGKFIAAG